MTLPLDPPRNNAAGECLLEDVDDDLPSHVQPCACEYHDGVCVECNYHVIISPAGVEYGHARARNFGPEMRERGDCPHRPAEVDPGSHRGSNRGESA